MKPILIIDNDQNFGHLLTQHLQREGYFTIQAFDVDETRKILGEMEPLVIAFSLLLPNGFELLEYMHEKIPDIPIVTFSNYSQDIIGDASLQYGVMRHFCRSEIDRLQEAIMDFANQVLPESERPFLHRLLYVYADPVKAGVLRASFKQRRFYTLLTSDLWEARAKLIAGLGVEMLLCDTMLSQGSALKFLDLLKKDKVFSVLGLNIPPCVVIRRKDDSIPEGAYLQEGAYECISEPIYLPTLLNTVEDYFELGQFCNISFLS